MPAAAQSTLADDVLAPVAWTAAASRMTVTVVGVPLLLQAFAVGFGTDVAAWWAPWALAAAAPYLLGARAGRAWAIGIAIVALVAGPAPLAGVVGGALAADVATRGVRPRFALPLALAGAIATSGLLALSVL